MSAPSVSYQISSLLWTRVSFEQSWCCPPHRLQGVTQFSEAGLASMGSLSRLLRLRPTGDWSSSAIFPFNCPTAPSARFWSPSGFSIRWRLLPTLSLTRVRRKRGSWCKAFIEEMVCGLPSAKCLGGGGGGGTRLGGFVVCLLGRSQDL